MMALLKKLLGIKSVHVDGAISLYVESYDCEEGIRLRMDKMFMNVAIAPMVNSHATRRESANSVSDALILVLS